MTQKELLYFEDAIGHLGNIDKLLNDFTEKVIDDQIKKFLLDEQKKLLELKSDLINVLGGNANGW